MKQTVLFLAAFFLTFGASGQESFDQQVREYVQKYKALAIRQQVESGVPAAITLAQGICETGAGHSELCRNANNHFGIKCKRHWKGATYAYSDDAPNECFRKYPTPQASYKDHSAFLRNNPRYARLFLLDPTDYKAWAHGLKRCGYATSAVYAQKLISYIERYDLEQYTTLALAAQPEDAFSGTALVTEPAPQTAGLNRTDTVTDAGFEHLGYAAASSSVLSDTSKNSGDVVRFYETMEKNGMKGFYAPKGDWLLEYAIKHHIRYNRLLVWNDLKDQALPANLFIYLEPKRKMGLRPTHTVLPGETLLQISQEEGIQLDQLMIFNQILPGEQPMPGEVLALQQPREGKPKVYEVKSGQTGQAPVVSYDPAPGEYIPTDRQKAILEKQPPEETAIPTAPSRRTPKTMATADPVVVSATPPEAPAAPQKHTVTPATGSALSTTEQPARNLQVTPEPKQQKKEAVPAPQTPLEKLRAYMDQVVYAEKQKEKAAAQQAAPSQKSITTLPAGKAASADAKSGGESQTSNVRFYTVKRGDTAYSIARQFHISLEQLKKWNQLPRSMTVMIGQRLRVAP